MDLQQASHRLCWLFQQYEPIGHRYLNPSSFSPSLFLSSSSSSLFNSRLCFSTSQEKKKEGDSNKVRRVDINELKAYVRRCMLAVGCSQDKADTVAEILVEADVRGVHSHGLNRLEMYVYELQQGEADAKAMPEIVQETASTACVDGHNGVGMYVAKFCMELAIKKAKQSGIGWVVTRGSNHYGIAGYYAMMASKQNMIGMSFTNTSPLVFPTRAAKAALGTNPIAVAAPTKDPEDPFVLDMATSGVAIGKVEWKDREQKSVPMGWGVNAQGIPTTDPKKILDGGGLMPVGGPEETAGYKGYGLAMMVELFCGVLAGSEFGVNIPPWRQGRGKAANLGQCFVCLDPSVFGDANAFLDRSSALMQQMRQLPAVQKDRPVLAPGDPEKATQKEYEREGIAFHQNLIDALQALAKRLNVAPLPILK
ncbi:malate dehydrogenase [Balamuthia mandrillaris]